MARDVNVSRWRNGSHDNHFTGASIFRKAFSAISTRYCSSTVVPTQAFSGQSISTKPCGNLVRNKNVHHGAARTSSSTASIHSRGTHLPNKSAIEHTKTLRQPGSVSASAGTLVY